MDYQKLFSFVKNLNSQQECLICRQDASNQEVNLPCNHIYHENCIIKNKYQKTVRCHYCNKVFTIKSITNKCVICNKKTILKNSKCSLHIDQEPVYCTAVIKSGPRKNQPCNKLCFNTTYCKRHCNYKPKAKKTTKKNITCTVSIKSKKKNVTCTAIIKTGAKKGTVCGRKCKDGTCGYHKVKTIVI